MDHETLAIYVELVALGFAAEDGVIVDNQATLLIF